MTEAWILLGGILTLVVVVTVVAVIYNLRFAAQVTEQFRILGDTFGLELTVPPRTMLGLYQRNSSLYGQYQGREVSIYPRGYGLDNTRQTDTALRMLTQAPEKLKISLARKSLPGKLGQLGRLKEHPTGDAAFDAAFSLRSSNPGSVAIFDEPLRQRILNTWQSSTGILTLRDRALTYEEMGLPRTEAERKHLEAMAHLCLEIADNLDTWSR